MNGLVRHMVSGILVQLTSRVGHNILTLNQRPRVKKISFKLSQIVLGQEISHFSEEMAKYLQPVRRQEDEVHTNLFPLW